MRMIALSNASHTPLRYPGGKGKITRFVGHLLDINGIHGTYIEPFAGGSGVAINLLLSQKVDQIIINDLDDGVNAFWKTLINDPDYLVDKIQKVPFDYGQQKASSIQADRFISYWQEIHARYRCNSYHDMRRKAFDFFMLNRMNISGVIKAGPIGGRSQSGVYNITSRFNKETLIQRIYAIAEKADHIIVSNREASFFCKQIAAGEFCDINDSFIFADPPYYVQGRNLYDYFATETIHTLLAEQLLAHPELKWILTYDKTKEIDLMYPDEIVKKYEYKIAYSANKRGKYSEYLFASQSTYLESEDNVKLLSLN